MLSGYLDFRCKQMKTLVLFLSLTATVLLSPTAYASHHGIFFGDFTGIFLPPEDEDGLIRDLSVSIHEISEGFNVSWDTKTSKGSDVTTKKYSIDFIETEREHIYKAAQRKNLFGGRDPLDPMNGDPYAWARIKDQTLTVYVMLITEDGGYEVLTYNRTLTDDGDLNTQFSRIRNKEVLKTIKATLKRQTSLEQEKNK